MSNDITKNNIPKLRRVCMDFKGSGSLPGCMRIKDMHLSLDSVFNAVYLNDSKSSINRDKIITILEPVKSCVRFGVQESCVILFLRKKGSTL